MKSLGVDRALAFLEAEQKENGEFIVRRGRPLFYFERWGWTSVRRKRGYLETGADMRGIFATALVARTMMQFPEDDRAKGILERAQSHLRSQRDPMGLWCYYGADCDDTPPDVDDTAYALLALPPAPQDRAAIDAILRNNHASGAICTWFRDEKKPRFPDVVDAVVNANVYTLFCDRSVSAPGVRAYLEQVLLNQSFSKGTAYYPSPFFFLYALAGVTGDLAPEAARRVAAELVQRLPRAAEGPVVDAALACAALSRFGQVDGAPRQRLVERILREQQSDGGWGAEPVFRGHFWYGSRGINTALCIQAIAA